MPSKKNELDLVEEVVDVDDLVVEVEDTDVEEDTEDHLVEEVVTTDLTPVVLVPLNIILRVKELRSDPSLVVDDLVDMLVTQLLQVLVDTKVDDHHLEDTREVVLEAEVDIRVTLHQVVVDTRGNDHLVEDTKEALLEQNAVPTTEMTDLIELLREAESSVYSEDNFYYTSLKKLPIIRDFLLLYVRLDADIHWSTLAPRSVIISSSFPSFSERTMIFSSFTSKPQVIGSHSFCKVVFISQRS